MNKRWLIIPLLGILNGLRGAGLLPRAMMYGVLAYWLWTYYTVTFAAIWTLGIALFLAHPWGNGFMVVTGKDTRHYNRSDAWLAYLVDKLTSSTSKVQGWGSAWDLQTEFECKRWGFIYMLIRGSFIMPLFVVLSQFYGWSNMLYSVIFMWFPVVYYIGGRISLQHGVRIAEILWGLILGLTIYMTGGNI